MRISEKHGVNPTMGVCFFCGCDDGTIGLLGWIKGDVEGPRRTILSYEPCDKCKAKFKLGIVLIECDEHPNHDDQSPIQRSPGTHSRASWSPGDLFPTGNWMVLKREAALRIFNDDMQERVMKHGRAYIDRDAFAMLQPPKEGES